MRTAGRDATKGPPSDPPAVASLPGIQTAEQHKHSQSLPAPLHRPPKPLRALQSGPSRRRGPLHPMGVAGSFFASSAQSLLESLWPFSSHTAHTTGSI